MFERYTEQARRCIFFARYEASQHDMPEIETPCLLLAIMREDKSLIAGLLPAGPMDALRLREEVEAILAAPVQPAEKMAANIDLRMSAAMKRAMSFAAV